MSDQKCDGHLIFRHGIKPVTVTIPGCDCGNEEQVLDRVRLEILRAKGFDKQGKSRRSVEFLQRLDALLFSEMHEVTVLREAAKVSGEVS